MKTQNLFSSMFTSFVRQLGSREMNEWVSGESVTLGTIRVHNDNKYIAKFSGRCGDNPPTHLQGESTDGKITWIFVERLTGLYQPFKNIYLLFGKGKDTFKDAFYAQKLNSENVRLGAKCETWISGKRYNADVNKIIRNSNYDLYVCIQASDEQSTNEPTETHDYNFKTLDGYVWRYIGSIDEIYRRFVTPTYAPISDIMVSNIPELYDVSLIAQTGKFETIVTDNAVTIELNPTKQIQRVWVSDKNTDLSDGDIIAVTEKNVKGKGASATATITDGKITGITVTNTGTGYEFVNVYIVGDGQGATATATIDAIGAITSIEIINQGENYTNAKIVIVAGKNTAILKASVKPSLKSALISKDNMNALLININISTKSGYIDESGKNSAYDYVALATSLYENKGDLANKQFYICYNNSNRGINSFPEIDKDYGLELTRLDFPIKQRASGQEENITLTLKLE